MTTKIFDLFKVRKITTKFFDLVKVSKQPSMVVQNKTTENKNVTIIQCQIVTKISVLIQYQVLTLALTLILVQFL